jgi:hypothetical protein
VNSWTERLLAGIHGGLMSNGGMTACKDNIRFGGSLYD